MYFYGSIHYYRKSHQMKKILSFIMALFAVAIVNAQPPQVPADAGATFGKATTAENAVSMEEYVKQLESKGMVSHWKERLLVS